MEQLVIVIFIIGLIYLGSKTNSPIYNLISAGFSFYFAFTVGVPPLMIMLIFLGLFQLVYIFMIFKK